MNKLTVRDTVPEDTVNLSTRLRQADQEEIDAGLSVSPLEALEAGLKNSLVTQSIIDDKGKVIGIFGLAPSFINDDIAMPWLLGSDELEKHSPEFLRRCKGWLKEFHRDFKTLEVFSYEKNILHHTWLKWCGFENLGSIIMGQNNSGFLYFKRSVSNV